MRCKQFRRAVALEPDLTRTASGAATIAHERRCKACERYRAQMERSIALLRSLPKDEAPDEFGAMVMARLARSGRRRAHGWLDRLAGVLRPPAPALAPRLATVAVVLLLMSATGYLVLGPDHTLPSLAPTHPQLPAVQAAAVTPDVVEQLVLQHSNYEASRPLGGDSGIQLIASAPAR